MAFRGGAFRYMCAMSERLEHGEQVRQAAERIVALAHGRVPRMAILLGTGLGGLADRLEGAEGIDYAALPGFPVPTVPGHMGRLLVGRLQGVPVLVLHGRQHFYETEDVRPLRTMVRAVRQAGAQILILSNAAGSLRAHMRVSELMLIRDHINFLGINPLVGPNDDEFGPRFFPLHDAWDGALRARVREVARERAIPLHEGVYVAFRGPSFETPAEIRMAQGWGADAVGMSSVPECLIARHCGLRVLGISCLTNMGAGLSDEVLTHEHTLAMAARGSAAFERLVIAAVGKLSGSG